MDLLTSITSIRADLVVVTLTLLIIYLVQSYRNKYKDFPPGPYGLPLVGYVPFLTTKPFLKFMKLKETYGDIISVSVGTKPVVVLNSGEVIREAFAKPELLGRPVIKKYFPVPMESPALSNGDVWVQHRRFVTKFFKDNDAATKTQFHIKDEIDKLLKTLEEQDSQPYYMTPRLDKAVFNYMSAMLLGYRYDYDNPERKWMVESVERVADSVNLTAVVMFFPWLKKIGFTRRLLKMHDVLTLYDEIVEYTQKKVKKYKEGVDDTRTENYLDHYLNELSLATKSNSTFSESLLPFEIQLLYAGGTETVRTALEWAFYTMAVHQDVQKKVQKEIDEIIGNNRSPLFTDQMDMPYTHSVIMELQRWKTVAPLGASRMALEDVYVSGYRIPKGTFVLSNLWSAHHNPDSWDHPEKFNPDRFLSADGTQVVKSPNYMPFSFGKRYCTGERIAVVQLFLYFTSVLQRFELRLPKNAKPDFEGEGAINHRLKPRKICFVPRVVKVT